MTEFITNICRRYCINSVINNDFMPLSPWTPCGYTAAILCTENYQKEDAKILDLLGWKASYTQLRAYFYTRTSDYNSTADWISVYSCDTHIQINMKKPEITISFNGISVTKPIIFNELDFCIEQARESEAVNLSDIIAELEF